MSQIIDKTEDQLKDITLSEAMQRVSNGMDFLISKGYINELLAIDLGEFNIAYNEYCIIGSIFGDFDKDHKDKLDLSHEECVEYGFLDTCREQDGTLRVTSPASYALLQEVWVFAIQNLRF